MTILLNRSIRAALMATLPMVLAGTLAAEPLPVLNVDHARITVSGVSSGGFMAVQMQVAHSTTVTGAGIVNGGPYNCAEGSVIRARMRCMATERQIRVDELIASTRERATSGTIDEISNLKNARVYLFASERDSVVKRHVFDSLIAYYQDLVAPGNLALKGDVPAEHAMVTDDHGGECATLAPPFINNCSFDLAGAILAHLYGPLQARSDGALSGSLREFDQTPFVRGQGMASTGWIFVPRPCSQSAVCRLHIVFHGCKQNSAEIGLEFVRRSGYNRWADTNNIAVLYPQTDTTASNGCWDWWGYSGDDYALKSGPQIAAVKLMIDHITNGEPGVASANRPGRPRESSALGDRLLKLCRHFPLLCD
jgi:hypothetical protein